MNTPHKGAVRYIVFKEDKTWYAVALELNIVESADDPQIALSQLFEATTGYIESFEKMKDSDLAILNQEVDKEYEKIWNNAQSPIPIKSSFEVSTYGITHI